MEPTLIKAELLSGTGSDLESRRKIITLSTIGLLDFSIISLFQSGVIKKMPDIHARYFDSGKVNSADDAYQLGAPDGTISALAYSAIMVLATWQGSELTGRKPVVDLMLGAVIAGNAAGAAYYLTNMVSKQKKICLYCVTGAVINFASSAIIFPVVKKALKKLMHYDR